MELARPGRAEADEYFFTYIDKVPGADALAMLREQAATLPAFLRSISEERAGHRYAEGKWTIREVLGHVNDTERVFSFRAFWFARGLTGALHSFDQNEGVAGANADARSWESHVREFEAIRASTLALFESLPPEAWDRQGTASGMPFTVRALLFITAGHVEHHVRLLRERYLG